MTTAPAATAAWLDSYRRSLRDSLSAARADGFHSIVASTTQPDLNPRDFGDTARRHLAKHLRDLGLGLGALATPWPGRGLADPALGDERLAHFRQSLELCAALKVDCLTATLAGLGGEQPDPLALEALRAVADLADRTGVGVALHSPGDDSLRAAAQIRALGCPGVQLALDTAGTPIRATSAAPLAGCIGMAQLRDVRRGGERVEEVEFGQGDVDFAQFLAMLAETGCSGPLTVRRDGDAGVDALRRGRDYIESLLARAPRR